MLKKIDVVWFTSRTTVGIVLCQDDVTETYKCYIGAGSGVSAAQDVMDIMNWGAKYPLDAAKVHFPILRQTKEI